MPLYVGVDASQKKTEICVINGDGCRTWRGKCRSWPESNAEVLRQHAPDAAKLGIEIDPLQIWLWQGLRALSALVDCIHARHVATALSLQVNNTDANNARGIAQVVRSGWYRAVGVNSLQNCRVRALLSARNQLASMRTSLSKQVGGLLKSFGVVSGPGKGGSFEATAVNECLDAPLVRTIALS